MSKSNNGHAVLDLRDLMLKYRSSCIHSNISDQALYINSILRYYVIDNRQYDQASKFISKITFPENNKSNAQYAKYLYYVGFVRAIELQYSEAHAYLTQAIRKAPQPPAAKGFRACAHQALILVELLMGEIPDRKNVFSQNKDIWNKLAPYFYITKVNIPSICLFVFSPFLVRPFVLEIWLRLPVPLRNLKDSLLMRGFTVCYRDCITPW